MNGRWEQGNWSMVRHSVVELSTSTAGTSSFRITNIFTTYPPASIGRDAIEVADETVAARPARVSSH